jgi:hypothetical protein
VSTRGAARFPAQSADLWGPETQVVHRRYRCDDDGHTQIPGIGDICNCAGCGGRAKPKTYVHDNTAASGSGGSETFRCGSREG